MRPTLALGVLVLTVCPAAPAQEKSPAAQAQELVKRLSSRKFTERERAGQALEALGEPALEPLRAAVRSDDLEVSQRAAALAARIERNATNARMLQVPTVRLKFDGTPLRTAVAELNRRTGLNLQVDDQRVGNPTRSVSVDTGDVPLWAAVEKFLEAAGLAEADQPADGTQGGNTLMMPDGSVRVWTSWSGRPPAGNNQGNRIVVVDGKTGGANSVGAVRVRALPRDFPGNAVTKGTGEINITLDVTPAPNLSWLGLVGIDVRRAVDEHGQHLTQSYVQPDEVDPNNVYFDGNFGVPVFQRAMILRQGVWMDSATEPSANGNPRHVSVALLGGPRSSKNLRELEGVVTARVLMPPQNLITVEDVLKVSGNNQFRAGSMTLQVLEAKPLTDGRVQLRVRLESTSSMANEFLQMGGVRVRGRMMPFLAMNTMYPTGGASAPQFTLFDTAGKPFGRPQQNHMSSTDNGITLTQEMQCVFPANQGQKPAARLVLTGRRSGDVEIPFVLKNVPLP